jgi:hypothetical protein
MSPVIIPAMSPVVVRSRTRAYICLHFELSEGSDLNQESLGVVEPWTTSNSPGQNTIKQDERSCEVWDISGKTLSRMGIFLAVSLRQVEMRATINCNISVPGTAPIIGEVVAKPLLVTYDAMMWTFIEEDHGPSRYKQNVLILYEDLAFS